jgi:hypothetical protein
MMATIRTLRRVPAAGRVLVVAAALALFLPGCDSGGNNRNKNQIRPVNASLSIQPIADPTAVYFAENSISGDLVLLDVRLRTTTSVTFDAFTLEIHFDPGVIALGGDFTSTPFTSTPFGACNQCVGRCNAMPCVKCEDCKAPSVLTSQSTSPFCQSNGILADRDGILLLGAAVVPQSVTLSGCPASVTVTFPPGDTKLMTIGLVATTVGSSRIELITNPISGADGDCEILNGLVDQAIPCRDGNATITGTR